MFNFLNSLLIHVASLFDILMMSVGRIERKLSDYVPYLDAFKFTWQVAVGDGEVEGPCQGATRGES